jgi:hypothetical protein
MAPRPLSSSVAKITVATLDRKALGLGALLGNWGAVVGPQLGQSLPVKLVRAREDGQGATLHLAVSSARALEFQHEEKLLIARINGFFGYKAIEKIKLVQRHSLLPAKRVMRAPSSMTKAEIETLVAGVENADLASALQRLGSAMSGRS